MSALISGSVLSALSMRVAAQRYGDQRRTFAEVLEACSSWIGGQVSPKTVARYATSLGMLEPMLDGLYLDEIDKTLIGRIVDTRKRSSVSNATIKRDLTALSSVVGFAEGEEWIDSNPVSDWLRPKSRRKGRIGERRDPIVLPDRRDVEFLASIAPPMFAALIRACGGHRMPPGRTRHRNTDISES